METSMILRSAFPDTDIRCSPADIDIGRFAFRASSLARYLYRGTSLIINVLILESYSRPMPRNHGGHMGGAVSFERGTSAFRTMHILRRVQAMECRRKGAGTGVGGGAEGRARGGMPLGPCGGPRDSMNPRIQFRKAILSQEKIVFSKLP